MLSALKQFFYMHGYGVYVFTAYGAVIALLSVQWFLSWRRWQQYLLSRKTA